MAQPVTQQFQAALSHMLNKEGRGAQSRLSGQQKIDRGYLNAIVKGRKPGSEEVRAKIAVYFHMTYDEMLALGRHLLEGDGTTGKTGISRDTAGDHGQASSMSSGHEAEGHGRQSDRGTLSFRAGGEGNIAEKIRKSIAILESDSSYCKVLSDLIDAFYEAVSTEGDNLTLRNKVSAMESRIVSLEKHLASKKATGRKSA